MSLASWFSSMQLHPCINLPGNFIVSDTSIDPSIDTGFIISFVPMKSCFPISRAYVDKVSTFILDFDSHSNGPLWNVVVIIFLLSKEVAFDLSRTKFDLFKRRGVGGGGDADEEKGGKEAEEDEATGRDHN